MGDALEDALDVVGKPHVEHFVGLVEHHQFDAIEVQRTAAHVVDDAPGCADHDVHAAVEGLQLTEDRLAAVDGHDLRAEVLAVPEESSTDLHGELARGYQYQRDGFGGGATIDQLQRRQRECSGFAGAGGGLTEEVSAGHQVRDGFTLDRGGFLVAEFVERFEQLRAQAERNETVRLIETLFLGVQGFGFNFTVLFFVVFGHVSLIS